MSEPTHRDELAAVDSITELDRIDVLAMVLQGRDGDHPSEFWRSRAHRLLNHRDSLLAVLGMEQVGWWHDDYGFEVTKHGIAGPESSGVPVYRIAASKEPTNG